MSRKDKIIPVPLDDAHYAAIGQVTANWAAFEATISSAIWQIGEIPDDIGLCITSQIYTYDAKLKALITILAVRGGLEKTIAKLNIFHEKTRGISNARNRITHDPWVGDLKSGMPHRLQITAQKRHVYEYKPHSTKELVDLAKAIWAAIDELHEILAPAIEKYPPLPYK